MTIQIDPSVIQQIAPISKALSSLSGSVLTNSIDESIKRDLAALHDKYFDRLIVVTVVVAVGVIFEEAENWLQYLSRPLRLEGMTVYRWRKKLVEIGWVLLVIGVMGEGIFEALVSRTDSLAHEFDEILLADARKQAGDAAASAKTAHDEASTAKDIADAAEKDAESERLARVQLQKELQPRRLTSAQEEKLTNLLRSKPEPIFILTMGGDPETADLASDIGDALNKAGWKTFFSVRFSFEHGIEVGTSRESDMSVLMPAIEKLESALSMVGLSSRTTLFDPNDMHLAGRFEKNVLCLVIDHKPVIKAPE